MLYSCRSNQEATENITTESTQITLDDNITGSKTIIIDTTNTINKSDNKSDTNINQIYTATKTDSKKYIIVQTTTLDTIIVDTIYETTENYGTMYHIKYDTMFVGVPKKIKFIISKKLLKKSKIQKNFNTTEVTSRKIRISNNIRVDLIDPLETNFKIKYIGANTKQHLDSSITTWVWWVTPLKPGNNLLVLCVDIFIDGTNKTKRYDDNIIVISNDTIINKIYIFFKIYWQWIIGTFILPFSVFIWKKKKKKKN
jgi:predicted secreted protein